MNGVGVAPAGFSHLQAIVVFAALTSAVLALLYRPRGRRLRFGLAVFAAFVGGTVAMAWLMAWIRQP